MTALDEAREILRSFTISSEGNDMIEGEHVVVWINVVSAGEGLLSIILTVFALSPLYPNNIEDGVATLWHGEDCLMTKNLNWRGQAIFSALPIGEYRIQMK